MKSEVKTFKDLIVWQRAYQLTLAIYKSTSDYPKHEQYGLSSQLRRAAVSVISNIAEGYARKGRTEYLQFLSLAYSSLSELEAQIMLSKDLQYINESKFKELVGLKDEVGGMLFSILRKLKSER